MDVLINEMKKIRKVEEITLDMTKLLRKNNSIDYSSLKSHIIVDRNLMKSIDTHVCIPCHPPCVSTTTPIKIIKPL